MACRFINADGTVSTETGVLGYNMFAYCNNNPVMFYDNNGEFLLTTFLCGLACAAISGLVSVGVSYASTELAGDGDFSIVDAVVAFSAGFVGFYQPLVGAGISAAYSGVDTYIKTGSVGNAIGSGLTSFAFSTVTIGNISNVANSGFNALVTAPTVVKSTIGSTIISNGIIDLTFGFGSSLMDTSLQHFYDSNLNMDKDLNSKPSKATKVKPAKAPAAVWNNPNRCCGGPVFMEY